MYSSYIVYRYIYVLHKIVNIIVYIMLLITIRNIKFTKLLHRQHKNVIYSNSINFKLYYSGYNVYISY